jgi:predicted nucleotidyltransferase
MQDIEQKRQSVIDHFVAACQADECVIAAFLSGSYAREATDAYSDIDFGLITTDAAYDTFFADRSAFVRLLGEPVFFEDFRDAQADVVFFTLREGIECELILGRESQFQHMHVGPYKVMLDKTNLLDDAVFPEPAVAQDEQVATLRSIIAWFWHDLCHHFITPLARGHRWSAYGGLQDLRLACVNLARLRANFSAALDGYEKVEQALPAEQLAPLEATCCPLERDAMLQAAFVIVGYYQNLAVPLTRRYGIAYPTPLERVIYARLETLRELFTSRDTG